MDKAEAAVAIKKLSKLSKGERTRLQIIQAARTILMSSSLDDLSYQKIADACGMTRQLVKSHFPRKAALVAEVAQVVREEYQTWVVSKLDTTLGPQELLASYIRAAIQWPLDQAKELSAWLAYLHLATSHEDFRKQNEFYAHAGLQRIVAMLKMCKPRTTLSDDELAIRARTIQNIILGTVFALTTEGALHPHLFEDCVERSVRVCLEVGLKQKAEAKPSV